MKYMTNAPKDKNGKKQWLTDSLKALGTKVKSLFEPEEVEVTFTKVGDQTRYSYTKVDHKHLA